MKEVFPDDKFPDELQSEDVDDYAGADAADTADDLGPFSEKHVDITSAITLMRIYDVLMAQFMADYPERGEKLLEVHAKGGLFGPPPAFDPNEVR